MSRTIHFATKWSIKNLDENTFSEQECLKAFDEISSKKLKTALFRLGRPNITS